MLVALRLLFSLCVLFFFKQKTAYEMRISDWSSDVCSSDLRASGLKTAVCGFFAILRASDRIAPRAKASEGNCEAAGFSSTACVTSPGVTLLHIIRNRQAGRIVHRDRKSVGKGESVSVRVDLGGRRLIKKKRYRDREETHLE